MAEPEAGAALDGEPEAGAALDGEPARPAGGTTHRPQLVPETVSGEA